MSENIIAKVVVGDWSRDGHNQFDTFTIEIPEGIDEDRLHEYVREAELHIGHGQLKQFCSDYEDSSISVKFVRGVLEASANHGVDSRLVESLIEQVDVEDPEDLQQIDDFGPEDFFGLWVALVNIGLSRHGITQRVSKYKPPKGKRQPEYNIGGYGLYWN